MIKDLISNNVIVCGQDPDDPQWHYYFSNGIGMKLNAVSAALNDIPAMDQNINLIPEIKHWFDKEPLAWFEHDQVIDKSHPQNWTVTVPKITTAVEDWREDLDDDIPVILFYDVSAADVYQIYPLVINKNTPLDMDIEMHFNKRDIVAIFDFAGENCQAFLVDGAAIAVSKRGDMAMCAAIDLNIGVLEKAGFDLGFLNA